MARNSLPRHSRYDYVPITDRKDYSWPEGKRLAFCITTNIECFAFGAGLGHDNAKTGEPQTLPATKPVPVYQIEVNGDDVMVVLP